MRAIHYFWILSVLVVYVRGFVSPTVVICAIAKFEDSYIEEWVRFHRFLGFDHIYLFDNSDELSMRYLASKYEGFVSVYHRPGFVQQMVVYNEFAQMFKTISMWAAFIDIDEFIVLHKHKSIKPVVVDHGSEGGALCFNWYMFGSNHHKNFSSDPVLQRFTRRGNKMEKHIKCIAYLPHIDYFEFPHNPSLKSGRYQHDTNGLRFIGFENQYPSDEIAVINHYFTKSLEEFERKIARGRSDIAEMRKMNEFALQDQNDVEDTRALDLFNEFRPIYEPEDGDPYSLLYRILDVELQPVGSNVTFHSINPGGNPMKEELVNEVIVSLVINEEAEFSLTMHDITVGSNAEFALVLFCLKERLPQEACLQVAEAAAEVIGRLDSTNAAVKAMLNDWQWKLDLIDQAFRYFEDEPEDVATRIATSSQGCNVSWSAGAFEEDERKVKFYITLNQEGDASWKAPAEESRHVKLLQVPASLFGEFVVFRELIPALWLSEGMDALHYVGIASQSELSIVCGDFVQRAYEAGMANGIGVIPLLDTGTRQRLLVCCVKRYGRRFKLAWDLLLQALGFDLFTIRKFDMIQPLSGHAMLIRPVWLRRLSKFMSEAMEQILHNEALGHYFLSQDGQDLISPVLSSLVPFYFSYQGSSD